MFRHGPTHPPRTPSRGDSDALEGPLAPKNALGRFDDADDPFAGPADVLKEAKPPQAHKLSTIPANLIMWARLNTSEEIEGFTIDTLLHSDSGSEIRLPQFLVLRAI
jgi:hypothetical protein